MVKDFADVTELAGTEISSEQLERMHHRYHWAALHSRGKDVLEVGCGSGQGLGMLARVAKSVEAGDYSEEILRIPRAHYGDRIVLRRFDARELPFHDASKDVVILFEAIYYIPEVQRFIAECRRVLRPGGVVLIATANKDLPDFNPSPLSYRYFGATELKQLFAAAGFSTALYGYFSVESVSWRQKVLRPVKRLVVELGLMPKTMRGKRLLKRLVFGKLVSMPVELQPLPSDRFVEPVAISGDEPDRSHKVLYCRASLSA
jgi:ubiquinone/menaquinone biosynthesis C-methylase UbiE